MSTVFWYFLSRTSMKVCCVVAARAQASSAFESSHIPFSFRPARRMAAMAAGTAAIATWAAVTLAPRVAKAAPSRASPAAFSAPLASCIFAKKRLSACVAATAAGPKAWNAFTDAQRAIAWTPRPSTRPVTTFVRPVSAGTIGAKAARKVVPAFAAATPSPASAWRKGPSARSPSASPWPMTPSPPDRLPAVPPRPVARDLISRKRGAKASPEIWSIASPRFETTVEKFPIDLEATSAKGFSFEMRKSPRSSPLARTRSISAFVIPRVLVRVLSGPCSPVKSARSSWLVCLESRPSAATACEAETVISLIFDREVIPAAVAGP